MNRVLPCLFSAGFFLIVAPASGQQAVKLGEFHPGTAGPALSSTDVTDPGNILLLDANISDFTRTAGRSCHQLNRVYVADGSSVRQFDRNDLRAGQMGEFVSGSEVLDVEAGSLPGQILVLNRTAVQVVDFTAAPLPRVMGSFPLPSTQVSWGNLIERFGDHLYVADCALPGFRVLDISDPQAVRSVRAYTTSVTGGGKNASTCPTDLQLRNGLVALIVRASMELVEVVDYLYPAPAPIYTARIPGVSEVQLSSSFAFLVDGSKVRILDILPGSPGFGREVSSFDTGSPISALRHKGNRLYVVCGENGFQIWDVSDFS